MATQVGAVQCVQQIKLVLPGGGGHVGWPGQVGDGGAGRAERRALVDRRQERRAPVVDAAVAERLAAALILEDRVRQLERVPDAVRVDLRADTLRDDVDEVVLEVLGDAGDEGDADRGGDVVAAEDDLSGVRSVEVKIDGTEFSPFVAPFQLTLNLVLLSRPELENATLAPVRPISFQGDMCRPVQASQAIGAFKSMRLQLPGRGQLAAPDQPGDAAQVLQADPGPAEVVVLGHAGGFLQEDAQLLGLGLAADAEAKMLRVARRFRRGR